MRADGLVTITVSGKQVVHHPLRPQRAGAGAGASRTSPEEFAHYRLDERLVYVHGVRYGVLGSAAGSFRQPHGPLGEQGNREPAARARDRDEVVLARSREAPADRTQYATREPDRADDLVFHPGPRQARG